MKAAESIAWAQDYLNATRPPIQQMQTSIYNANTTDSALVTPHVILARAVLNYLTDKLPVLKAFTVKVETKPLAPKAVVQVPIVLSGGTPQTNATSFEDSTNFISVIDNVAVTVNQITAGCHITNAERQGGFTLNQVAKAKIGEFANAITDVVLGPVTEAIFGAATVISTPAAFGGDKLAQLYAAISADGPKACLLDTDMWARFMPSQVQEVDPNKQTGIPGWAYFVENSRWSNAGVDVAGFSCLPSAIAVAIGVPEESPQAGLVMESSRLLIEQLGIEVLLTTWWSNVSRTTWMNLDVCIGAKEADTNALKILRRV